MDGKVLECDLLDPAALEAVVVAIQLLRPSLALGNVRETLR